jgi:hypothetical protein
VVRNLLRQLLAHGDELPADVTSLYDRSAGGKTEPTDKVWIDTLCKLIHSSSQVYILLDGFDECPDRIGLNRFFRSLKLTAATTYVAGRAPIDLEVDFHRQIDVEIVAPRSALATYIESYFEEDEDLSALLTDSLRTEITTTLLDYAHGVKVLWFRFP